MGNFFAKNLKHLREQKNLSKSELANKLKVSQSTISRWENNEMGITLDNLYDLSHILNVSISDLSGVDLTQKQNNFDKYAVLFNKFKELSNEDKELIANIIETRKNQIDKELDKE